MTIQTTAGMTEEAYKKAVSKPGRYQGFERVATDDPAAKFKGQVTLTRKVRFTGRTGIRYENLAIKQGQTIHPRKWGVRRDRWFVDHTPKGATENVVYATVFAVAGSFRTTYYINGEEATREAYNAYRTASAAKGKALDESGYMDIRLDSLTPLVRHTLSDEQVASDIAAEVAEALVAA